MKSNLQGTMPHCADHLECTYQLLLLSQKCTSNRILCTECLYSQEKAKCKEEFMETIPLSIVTNQSFQALRQPEIMVDQIKKDQVTKFLIGLFKICDLDLDKQFNEQMGKFEQLIKICNQMKEQILQKLEEFKEIQNQLQKLKEQFFEKCNFNILKQLIDQLKELEKQQKSDQYMQIIAKINTTIEEILKDNCALISKNSIEIQKIHRQMKIKQNKNFIRSFVKPNNNDQFLSQITSLFSEYSKFVGEINQQVNLKQFKFQFPQLKILTNEFFYSILQKVEQGSQKQIEQLNLIYLGSRDGLNGNAFWNKANGKRNLLMIFKSQNNQVFGGYSPCLWNYYLANYVQDETLTSFLFSQTKNQIYPLNQTHKQYAIYCYSSYGPTFGRDYDMRINADFNSGSSSLGNSYILDQQYKNQRETHLFGETQPKIIECEIYELALS